MRPASFNTGRAVAAAAFAVAVFCLFVPDVAHAQAVGGGGQLNSLITWVVTNFVRVMISAGIIVIALSLLAMRFNYVFVLFLAAGGLVAANYQTLAGMFPV